MSNSTADVNSDNSREYQLTPELYHALLESNSDERSALAFFKEYPWPLFWTICTTGGHFNYMFKEFPLGSQFVCDFVIVNCYSGLWEVKFIELEPIGGELFTRKGDIAKRLNGAITQVNAWKAYFEMNKSMVIEDLCIWMKSKDLLKYHAAYDNPSNYSGNYFKDPKSYVSDDYFIFIGRSSNMTPDENTRKARLSQNMSTEVATYERLLPVVERRYPLKRYGRDTKTGQIVEKK